MADHIVSLAEEHERPSFQCGNTILDRYFHQQVSQDLRAKVCTCFILAEEGSKTVKGYYTLSSASIERDLVPEAVRKKLPRYKQLPVTLLGRLAVDEKFKGNGFGAFLLIDALVKCYEISQTSIGSMAVVVDPIDADAQRFYAKYGFITIPDSEKMFIPMKTVSDLFVSKS